MQKYLFMQWLEGELLEARLIQAQLNKQAHDEDYDDYEVEIARHEQDGWVNAIEYVSRAILEKEAFE